MNSQELLALALAGQPLDPDQQTMLAEALADDAGLRSEAISQLRLQRTLLAARQTDAAELARQVRALALAHRPSGIQRTIGAIDRRLVERRRQRRRLGGAVLLAATLLLAAGLLAILLLRPSAVLATWEGGNPVRAGMTIEAGATAGTLRFNDGTRLSCAPGCRLRVIAGQDADGQGQAKRVGLESGRLDADVAAQPAGQAMHFVTPQAEAVVVGTRLRLTLSGATTRLDVSEGTVELVQRDRAPVTVTAGQFAIAGAGIDPASRPIDETPSTASGADRLLHLDFEDGIKPPVLSSGRIDPGPGRTGNRYCVAGVTTVQPWAIVQLDSGDDHELFAYGDDLALTFDYWVDGPVKSIDCYLWNDTRQQTFGNVTLSGLVPRTWTRATVKLAELRTQESGLRQQAGDRIRQVALQAGQQGGTMYVDNLEIVRSTPAKTRQGGAP